jgi:hypothetical protein
VSVSEHWLMRTGERRAWSGSRAKKWTFSRLERRCSRRAAGCVSCRAAAVIRMRRRRRRRGGGGGQEAAANCVLVNGRVLLPVGFPRTRRMVIHAYIYI